MPTLSYDVQAVLATDKVRYQGQEVAFVIAEDHYSARDAVELIDVEYDPLPAVVDARRALDPDAPVIRDDQDGRTGNHIFDWESGDKAKTDEVFANAEVVVAEDILYPRVHPAPLETCGAVADMDPVTGKLTVWTTTQAPHAHRTVYALVAGLPEHKIRIIAPDIGGGFGGKVGIYPGYVMAIVGSIVAGKPVKWVEDRSEHLMSTAFARDYHMRGEIAATKDGKILGLRVKVIADHGAFNATAQPTKFPAGFFHVFTGSYDLQAAHCEVTGVYTNKAPGGVAYACSFRITEAVYLVERMVDVLAYDLKLDPAELRMKNLIQPEQFPYTTPDRLGVRLRRLPAGPAAGDGHGRVRRAAQGAGGEAPARRADGHRRRVLHRGGRRRPAQAHGHPRPRHGRRRRAAHPPDRQGGAAHLGADPGPGPRDDVRADRRPRARAARPTTSRWCTATPTRRRSGWAPTVPVPRRSPARRPRSWPARSASGRRSSRPRCSRSRRTTWSGRGNRWQVRGDPEQGKTIQEIALAAHSNLELPEGVEGHLDATTVYNPPNLTYPFGAYICVVDVDPGTGGVKVRRFIAVDDCGPRINPMIVEGQVHGGLADGVGHGADAGDRVRRGRQPPRGVLHGLPPADRRWNARRGSWGRR